MQYQWYPGHMTKAKRQMMEDLKLIDVVVELVDARIPYSSKNPDIGAMANGKSRVLLLNKADLSDREKTAAWKTYYEMEGYIVVTVDSRGGSGIKEVGTAVAEACREKTERDRRRGIQNRPVRAMVAGIPNVGKSTFINAFAKRAVTKTGNKPGVTKGKQWIRLNKDVELLDTPGILWPKFEDRAVGLRIALIGSINDEILVGTELGFELCNFLTGNYPGALALKYGIEECSDGNEMLLRIARARAWLKKGGELDVEKAAGFLLDDFRNGKIGCFTLEMP
ncbi:MAG: ribosome biogenesis GTPase YlqF [Lachnospiraceae bacterium]|nr:ribosome biogenesis GTPase YlqF [Lachnospiraceae bacterium]